ncbi:Electron transfer DM13 [Nostoc sphaeroides CCNUC1]|uniref:Electron transfer DM13 n=1 Tax=Nostoc sphaeroides CCNUC1 TaxID=2653204 RepID=A0A5P8WFY4_9NOSO|nr:Electron transfer DM13 [Nostoc sphaeroides CCNUC1]
MKLRYLLILGLSSLVMVGCVREVSKNQTNESPIAVNASVPVSSTQAKPLAKSAQSPN